MRTVNQALRVMTEETENGQAMEGHDIRRGLKARIAARMRARRLAGPEGIDAALRAQKLDVLLAPTTGVAWPIDPAHGDRFPGAGYGAFADLMETLTAPLGLQATRVSVPEALWQTRSGEAHGERINLIARHPGDQEVCSLYFHVDTVPAGDGWNHPPLQLTEADGKLIGRGLVTDEVGAGHFKLLGSTGTQLYAGGKAILGETRIA